MVHSILHRVKSEYNSYGRAMRWFIACMMLCSFSVTAEASITRASANSVFITAYTVKYLPLAWLASVPLNLIIVSFYNRFIAQMGCGGMMRLSIILAIGINIGCAYCLNAFAFLPFCLYLWKDIFIILMFQQLWSVIHSTIQMEKAEYLYGIFFGMGGLGSVAGSLIPGYFALWVGSERLLLFTIPFYLMTWLFYKLALRIRSSIDNKQDLSNMNRNNTDIAGGLRLIRHSPFLIFILLIVISMQVSATILDFQFNFLLERSLAIQDLRTQFLGRFFSVVNTVNVFLQFLGSFFLVRYIGLKGAHIFVPLLLGAHAIHCLFYPQFIAISVAFATNKAMDYSVFGIIKEMLYVPLKVEDKFKAKAIIDVFAYRSSKACASLVILGLSTFAANHLLEYLTWGVFILYGCWLTLVLTLFSYYDKAVEERHIYWPCAE